MCEMSLSFIDPSSILNRSSVQGVASILNGNFSSLDFDIVYRVHPESTWCSIIKCNNCSSISPLTLWCCCLHTYLWVNPKLIINLTILMTRLGISHMPCNSILFAVNDRIGHAHVIWIDLKSNNFYVLMKLPVIQYWWHHHALERFQHLEVEDLLTFFKYHSCCIFLDQFLIECPLALP